MNKKFLTIILVISVLSLMGGVGVLVFNKTPNNQNETNSSGDGGLKFRDFFTFGGKKSEEPSTENPTESENQPSETPTTPSEIPKLRQISFEPTTGYGTLVRERELENETLTDTTQGTTPTKPEDQKKIELVDSVRYQDKTTGHIYQTYLDIISPEKISNTTIPKVHHSFFVSNSEALIDQYTTSSRSIETYHGQLTKDTTGAYNGISGTFLPKDILDISVLSDSTKIFYISSLENGVVGTIASPKGDSKIQVFSSKFSEWLSQFPNSKLVTVTTKPSARVLGYMYGIDTTTKSFDKILGGINGLTTLTSPDGKQIIYNTSVPGGITTSVYNKETKKALALGLVTLPEKCVWSKDSKSAYCAVPQSIPKGEYPDTWYQGSVSFNDSFWKLDVETNIFELLYDTASEGRGIDGIKLQLSSNQRYLLFVNKVDNQLWAITL